jgi:CAAX protease family protein
MENHSTRSRILAFIELAVIFAVFLTVKAWASSAEIFAAGSLAILTSFLAGTLLMKFRGKGLGDLGLRLPSSFVDWLRTLGLFVIAVGAVFVGTQLIVLPILESIFEHTSFDGGASSFSFFLNKPLVFGLYIITVVWVGAAFGEEMLFRGFAMNNIAECLGSSRLAWTIALLSQAALFGFGHGYQGWIGIILTGSVGLIFGAVYLLGKRAMLPLIIAHGFIDTLSLTQFYFSASQG